VDFQRLGRVGQQSQSQVLFHHAGRAKEAGIGGRELGTDQRRDWTRAADR